MIQDAILEKCIENGAGVVHIAVDKSSVEVKENNKLAKCPQNRKEGFLIVLESRELALSVNGFSTKSPYSSPCEQSLFYLFPSYTEKIGSAQI